VLALAAAVTSGAALAASRPPLDLGPLALVALVPLFVTWRSRAPARAASLAFVAGVTYHALLASWIWYFGAVALVPFVVTLAAYWAAAGAAVAWFARQGFRSPWLTAAIWVLAEAAVARWPFGGLSWGEVGYALHDVPAARDLAGVGGLPLVSFLAVATNALVADLFVAARERRRAAATSEPVRAVLRAGAGLAAVVVLAPVLAQAAPATQATGDLRVALIQGNDKNRDLTAAEERARYLPRRHFALAREVRDPVDLIVLPESSLDEDPRTDPYLGRNLRRIAREHGAWVLANAVADRPDGRASNLDVLYGPDGTLDGTYAKRHLVPYGEYVPFRRWLEGVISALDQIPRDFVPGSRPGLFEVAGHRVGTIICFESAFGHEVRPLVRDGAEVIVLSTNNRSYRRSANSAQHLAIGQMRAAETGRPIVHAAISGLTAVIDRHGNVHGRTELFESGVVQTTVEATTGETLYVRYGEWVAWGALAGVAGCALTVFARRRRASVDSTVPRSETSAGGPVLEPSGDRA
jgi:apolipoprotein N-acyltransferase